MRFVFVEKSSRTNASACSILYRPEIQFYISKYDQSPFSRTFLKKKSDE